MSKNKVGVLGSLRPVPVVKVSFSAKSGQIAATLLTACAVLNSLDLITTFMGLARGLVEAYLPSILIMQATGFLGYALIKICFSILLLGNGWYMRRKLGRLTAREAAFVLGFCLALLALIASPVVNNLAVMW